MALLKTNIYKDLGLLNLEKNRLWEDLIADLQYSKGAYKKAGEGHLIRAGSSRTRGSGFKLKEDTFRIDIGKTFFAVRVLRH